MSHVKYIVDKGQCFINVLYSFVMSLLLEYFTLIFMSLYNCLYIYIYII